MHSGAGVGRDASNGGAPFTYRANGLVVSSAIELPVMDRVEAGLEPDAVIRYGPVPDRIRDPLVVGPRSVMGRSELLLEIRRVARYWVEGGRQAVLAPEPGAAEADVRVFVLSSVMAALAHQNGMLPLHASAVEVGGECVLFLGGPGSGKSTLAAAFYLKGYPLVADDISVVSLDAEGVPVVHPGYRHLKLWRETLEHLGSGFGEVHPTRLRLDKLSVRVRDRVTVSPLRIRKIYRPVASLSGRTTFEAVTGGEKLELLRQETYRRKFIKGFGIFEGHFALCSRVARDTPLVIAHRPWGLQGLDDLVERIEADLALGD